MLSNIASIEIPAIERTLVDWLKDQPCERLAKIGVDPGAIDDRAFYPRVALGEYLHDQFGALIDRARASGIDVDLRTRSRVAHAAPDDGGFRLTIRPKADETLYEHCDFLVIATGHQWPREPEVRPGHFLSPWPASILDGIAACSVGIRGTSLTAIDAAVVLALRFGSFVEEGERLRYEPSADSEAFQLTMMSRKGLLPEADFYHPIPYEPLSIVTPEAIDNLLQVRRPDILDRAFVLFKQDLAAADPAYAAHVGLDGLDLEGFRDGYFHDRAKTDPFLWAERNLAEAERNHRTETTVPWRYAILRMHEAIAPIVPNLDDRDFERFNRCLKPVFVDDYATVPHESIRRILALHDAGKIDLVALGDDYSIDRHSVERGVILDLRGHRTHFPVFIEATGQHPLGIGDFPFPSLRAEGVVTDAAQGNPDRDARGISVDGLFHPIADSASSDRLFCLSLPFILGRHPFIQGITISFGLGEIVGRELADALERSAAHSSATTEAAR